jgi:hypothetical protein
LEKVIGGSNESPQLKSSSPGGNNPQSPPSKRSPTETTRGPRASSNTFTGTAAKPALENPPDSELRADATPSFAGAELTEEVPTSRFGSEIDRLKSVLETKRKMFLVTVLEAANSVTLVGNELSVEFAPEARHFRDTLAKSENAKVLREACQEITNREVGVRIAIQDQEPSPAPPSKEDEERREKQLLKESAEKNPVVQQMLRTFRGEIVDVRRVERER